MADTLTVAMRNDVGTRAVRRMRKSGQIPAVLYGHKKECINLAMSAHDFRALLRQGRQLVDLTGDITEKALIKDVQWDTFSTHVLHVDLARVLATERVKVTVPIEFRGEAPGSKQGGVVEHVLYEIEVECPAAEIPEKVTVHLNTLELGDRLTAEVLELPAGATMVTGADAVIAHCMAQEVEEEEGEEEAVAPGASEPEVIGRKADADEEGES